MAENNTQQAETILVSYSHYLIPVQVLLEERNQLSITIQPDKTVTARAPKRHTLEEIRNKLQKRAPWMVKHLEYFEQYHPIQPERRYISGETYYYLGRQYRLKISPGNKNGIKLIGKYFQVSATEPGNPEHVKVLLQTWCSEHAKTLILNRVNQYMDRMRDLGASQPEIKFRRMNKRWGSCAPKGVITFNTELVKAPIHCIDYVVLHELCHLVQEGHSAKFYHLLDVLMPDWRKRKERLEQVVLV